MQMTIDNTKKILKNQFGLGVAINPWQNWESYWSLLVSLFTGRTAYIWVEPTDEEIEGIIKLVLEGVQEGINAES